MNDVSGLQHLLARSTVGALPPPRGYQPAVQTRAPNPPLQARLPAADPAEVPDEQDAAPSRPRHPGTWTVGERAEMPENPAAEADFSFADFLDIINPLQHIPIVSTIYRAITGDEISGPARILGGFLFGGPIGFVVGIVNAVTVEVNDGRDLGETALAALFGDEETPITDPVTGFAIARAGPGQLIAEAVPGPLVTAAGPEPEGHGTTQMTGQAALDALASDLRGQTQLAEQQADNPIPTAPVIPVIPVSLDAQSSPPPVGVAPGLVGTDPAAVSADPRFVGALLGGKAFADRMMNALDQYRTMSKGHGAVPVGRNLDGKF
ncbi:MAG: hypothetical protein V3S40_10725 [Kiloniellales bacterium]